MRLKKNQQQRTRIKKEKLALKMAVLKIGKRNCGEGVRTELQSYYERKVHGGNWEPKVVKKHP